MKTSVTFLTKLSFVIWLAAISCSGSGNASDPVSPQNNQKQQVFSDETAHTLMWGLWDVSVDVAANTMDVVPLRSANFAVNSLQFIDSPPPKLHVDLGTVQIDGTDIEVPVDVGIEHPFLGFTKFQGFDLMLVVMGNGSDTYPGFGGFDIFGDDDLTMRNADGYTRWFNFQEFSDLPSPLFNAHPGAIGTQGFIPTAELNPYKYYADGLDPDEDEFDFLQANPQSRGVFRDNSFVWRHLDLVFQHSVGLGLKFQYCVIAHWAPNVNTPDPPNSLDDFPPQANAEEAVVAKIENYSTVYFDPPGDFGGQVILDISPWDWSADFSAATGEFVIRAWSDAWAGTYEVPMIPVDSGDFWNTFRATIDVDNITGNDPVPVWIEVSYPGLDYSNGGTVSGIVGSLGNYYRYVLPVPGSNTIIVDKPQAGDNWGISLSKDIRWHTINTGGGNLKIEYYTDGDYAGTAQTIISDTVDDGIFTWNPIPDDPSDSAQIRISLVGDPSVYGESGVFSIFYPGWTPSSVLTQPFPFNQPYQSSNNIGDLIPVDVAATTDLGAGFGETLVTYDGTGGGPCGMYPGQCSSFVRWGNGYTTYFDFQWWQYDPLNNHWPIHFPNIDKFDINIHGHRLFITYNCFDPFHATDVTDKMGGFFTIHDNLVSSWSTNSFISPPLFYGDGTIGGGPDPDIIPHHWVCDFSTSIKGGWHSSNMFQLWVDAPTQPNPGYVHDGMVHFARWSDPYYDELTSTAYRDIMNAPTSTHGTGAGLVNDSLPWKMALAADNNTGLQYQGSWDVTTLWVLGSDGRITPHLFAWDLSALKYWGTSEQLNSSYYGSGKTPVDLEMLPAKFYNYDQNGFDWLAVLLDNGNGTFDVAVWETVYQGNINLAGSTINFVEVAHIGPYAGMPHSLDVDNGTFEIHVMSRQGSTILASVFRYLI